MAPAISGALTGVATTAKAVLSNKYVQYGLIITAIVLILYWVSKKTITAIPDAINQVRFNQNESGNIIALVQRFRGAFNPSGYTWMIDWDGTDEEMLMKLAVEASPYWNDVVTEYRRKFDENLTDRLRSELSSEDFNAFMELINE